MPETIAVIIPVLNEVNHLRLIVEQLYAQAMDKIEVIVVDGGSRDGTVELAQKLGITVIVADRGKACQMNAGAAVAQSEILLFLHADTLLPKNFDQVARQVLVQPQTVAGAFRLQIDDPTWGLRIIERLVNWRSRWLQMPYGDQAIFLSRQQFLEIGGFPDLPIMEDYELIRRLRCRGQIKLAPAAVLTSARRWRQLGILRTTAINQTIVLAYRLGISPEQLARWYRSAK